MTTLKPDIPVTPSASPGDTVADRIVDALRWALDTSLDASLAAADWLAHDINPSFTSAIELLTGGKATVEDLKQAKLAFKTLRLLGETVADRRLGAQLYLAAIAAALVQHKQRITRQSDTALFRALDRLVSDRTVAQPLRHLAGMASVTLRESQTGP